MTTTDLRLEFSKEEAVQYSEVCDSLPLPFSKGYGDNIKNQYIAWLESELLIYKNKTNAKEGQEGQERSNN